MPTHRRPPDTALEVLIADSDAAARAHLRQLLSVADIPCVVEVCETSRRALERLRHGRTDLVLLDADLKELGGFGVVRRFGHLAMPPFALMSTADRRCLDAFALGAIGYLIKPVAADALHEVIHRARRLRSDVPRPTVPSDPTALPEGGYVSRLAVRRRGQTVFVRVEDLDWLEARDMMVRLHTSVETYELREPLSELERLLSPRDFVRVQRGAIVRVDRIREIQSWFRGNHVIILVNGTRIVTGHAYRAAVRALLTHR